LPHGGNVTAVQRVLVYGVTGSGKSTLARRIAERCVLPCHDVDDLTWEPGWVPVPDEVQRARLTAVCAGDEWVIDSAYGKWLDVPLARTDLVVGVLRSPAEVERRLESLGAGLS
jgi:adenylate kinase family enzyme